MVIDMHNYVSLDLEVYANLYFRLSLILVILLKPINQKLACMSP
jgi:hypothetical protein